MGIEADKEAIGSNVWVDKCKFAQDRANKDEHVTSDIGVLWAEDKIAALEAKVAAMEWTEVESGGMPDEEGWYLCAFSDGSVESFPISIKEIEGGGWKSQAVDVRLTHWTANPAHPEAMEG